MSRDFTGDHILGRPWLTALLLAAGALVIGVLLSSGRRPNPLAHDEFSYLLAADTFCHGRLANPTHPLWEHFESFHIIHQPTYASKYPPGQGLALAAGQWLTGEPIAGIWLVSGIASAACYWMLLGWTTPRWAALGGVLFVVHPGYQIQWGQSYWGGTLAFAGGALVFGAALRLRRQLRLRDALAMSAGAVILSTTRPFEGFIFCMLIGLWVLAGWLRLGLPGTMSQLLMRTALPQTAVLGAGLGGLLAYHAAVTGDPLTLPYMVHERTYAQAPMFHGQPPTRPAYRHAMIEKFHSGWAMDWYRNQASLGGWISTKWRMGCDNAKFFLPGLLAMPVAVLLVGRSRARWGRAMPTIVIAAVAVACSLISLWNFPHYLAPVAPLLMLLVVAGMRLAHVACRRSLRWNHGPAMLIGAQLCLFAAQAIAHATTPPSGWSAQRAAVQQQLERTPGRHLVIVRYGEEHDPNAEWVYNRAEIDAAKIVWAREMDAPRNDALRRYFADRMVWLLEPDAMRLRRFSTDGPGGVAITSESH